jgi:hypothetical protein
MKFSSFWPSADVTPSPNDLVHSMSWLFTFPHSVCVDDNIYASRLYLEMGLLDFHSAVFLPSADVKRGSTN